MIKIPTRPRPGVIRPGQRKPYRKGTHAQIDQRRGHVARMLANGATKTAIHRAIRKKFNREWRTSDRDIAFIIGTNTRLGRAGAKSEQKGYSALLAGMAKAYDSSGK